MGGSSGGVRTGPYSGVKTPDQFEGASKATNASGYCRSHGSIYIYEREREEKRERGAGFVKIYVYTLVVWVYIYRSPPCVTKFRQ